MVTIVKKGILLVSLGKVDKGARRENIEVVENKIRGVFNNYEVRSSFTSNQVIEKLRKEENILIDNPDNALLKMKDEGFQEVVIQPLQIIPGIEYEKVQKSYNENINSFKKIGLGKPVLYDIKSYKEAVSSLKSQLPKMKDNSAIVIVGHGTNHPSNACYSCLQSVINDEKLDIYVGTLGGYPNIDNVLQKLKDNRIEEITLMPYLLVTGNHVKNDIFSDNVHSWKTIIEKEGIIVNSYIHGLTENVDYQNIFVNRIKETIQTLNC